MQTFLHINFLHFLYIRCYFYFPAKKYKKSLTDLGRLLVGGDGGHDPPQPLELPAALAPTVLAHDGARHQLRRGHWRRWVGAPAHGAVGLQAVRVGQSDVAAAVAAVGGGGRW